MASVSMPGVKPRAGKVSAQAGARVAGGSAGASVGAQGTLGGRAQGIGAQASATAAGDAPYLWVLVALELGAIALLRHQFRRYHGG